MSIATAPTSFSIGWDVGGWNCDNNNKSRDAIVILSETLSIVGQPWRGNLRDCIAAARTTDDWLKALFAKCDAVWPTDTVRVTMAIDAPLGFSDEFVGLVTGESCVEPDVTSGRNRYLFRQTERHLFERGLQPLSPISGLRPLSPIKDMIGSQATKGMHVLAKFAPKIESCGVWTDGHGFRAIETYPTACQKMEVVKAFLKSHKSLGHDDKDDARICAVIAHLFTAKRGTLEEPNDRVPLREGWIWVPQQTMTQARPPKESHA